MSSPQALNTQILETHGDELRREFRDQFPPAIALLLKDVVLTPTPQGIQVQWELHRGTILQGPTLDFQYLTQRFPDSRSDAMAAHLKGNTILTISIHPDILSRLDAQADWDRLPHSLVVERALKAYFSDHTLWSSKHFNDGSKWDPPASTPHGPWTESSIELPAERLIADQPRREPQPTRR